MTMLVLPSLESDRKKRRRQASDSDEFMAQKEHGGACLCSGYFKMNSSKDKQDHQQDQSTAQHFRVEKIVLFLLKQQGLLARRLSKLREDHSFSDQQSDIMKICEVREAYRPVGHDLLKLVYFFEVNAVGLRKILKKFYKSLGYKFADYYVKTQANQTHSHMQQVSKHVGLGAVMGAIIRNLGEIEERQGSHSSIYDQPSLNFENPLIESIKAATEKLSSSTDFFNSTYTLSSELHSLF